MLPILNPPPSPLPIPSPWSFPANSYFQMVQQNEMEMEGLDRQNEQCGPVLTKNLKNRQRSQLGM